ncbi:MAG: cytochrome c biogenesis protein CcsA [Planctomycetes bacterium]|nr:cytochrome c biogenesis protein CcsA [Planctomycetota bacterium]
MNLEALFRDKPLIAALMGVHALTIVVGLLWAATRRKGFGNFGILLLLAAFGINTAILATSWSAAGRAPIKTLYETLLLYPWCVALVTMLLLAMYRLKILIPFSAVVSLAGLVYAVMKPDVEILNLPPALQSFWFIPHVVTYFVAYAGLFASFKLAILALVKSDWRSERSGFGFEQYAHRAAMFGFAALTLGIVMGAIWGKEAWGDYWGWDPKENWALVTFLVYLAYLHLRLVRGWQGTPAMVVLLVSFAAVVFTYLGMSLLPSAGGSLHVYQ